MKYSAVHMGINKVCTLKTKYQASDIKLHNRSLLWKHRNSSENIIFTSYVTYLTVTICIIPTHTHTFWMTSTSTFIQRGIPASSRPTTKVLVRNMYYTEFDLFRSPICSQQTRPRSLERGTGSRDHRLQFAVASATRHLLGHICPKEASGQSYVV